MSIDIELFLEIDRMDRSSKLFKKPFTNVNKINLLAEGSFLIRTDYSFFSAISDVLIETGSQKPLIQSRGLPKYISKELMRNLSLLIIKDDEALWNGIECISQKEAEKNIEKNKTFYMDDKIGMKTKNNVFNYEYYSSSWLYLDELLDAIKHHEIKKEELGDTVQIVISIMKNWEKMNGNNSIRCVFCFSG